jgi:hypothetical protein
VKWNLALRCARIRRAGSGPARAGFKSSRSERPWAAPSGLAGASLIPSRNGPSEEEPLPFMVGLTGRHSNSLIGA